MFMILPDKLSIEMVDMLEERDLENIDRYKALLDKHIEQINLLLEYDRISKKSFDDCLLKIAHWDRLVNIERDFVKNYYRYLRDSIREGVLSNFKKGG